MKIITTEVIKDFKGEPIKNEKGQEVTARDIISIVLNMEDNDHRLTAEKKNQAFQIGIKLWQDKEIDLTVEQAAFIKERVGYFYSPIIYGRICELIEGKK